MKPEIGPSKKPVNIVKGVRGSTLGINWNAALPKIPKEVKAMINNNFLFREYIVLWVDKSKVFCSLFCFNSCSMI